MRANGSLHGNEQLGATHMTQATNGPREGDAPLRVIVADDDALVRRVVRDALQRAGIVVIAEAGSGREAIELTLYYKPDVVLMDLVMPGIDGIAATREIVAGLPDTKIVVLSSSDDDELGLLSLRMGACGYLTGTVDVDSLPRALRAANEGEAVVPRRLTGRLVEAVRRMREDGRSEERRVGKECRSRGSPYH